ncbi:MAG: efflux RND transporter permease subunit [Pseudomonadota bacterium]
MRFNLAELSIRYPLFCWIAMIICLVGGWQAYDRMPRFEDPEFTIRVAKVFTPYPGASPQEVVDEVTEPIETALQQLAEVKEISSVSSAGLSEINVEVRFDYSKTRSDLQVVWTKIRNAVKDAESDLPPGAGPSTVNDDFGDVYGIYYMLTGDGFSDAELIEFAKQLRKDLLLIEGIAKIQLIGEQKEAIYVEVPRERASALGVSITELYNALSQQNEVAPAGDALFGDARVDINPSGAINSIDAIERLLIANATSGAVLRLGAIANVSRGYEDPPTKLIRFDGKPAIGLGISNLPGTNVVKLGQAVDEELQALKALLPLGVEVHEYYHQGKVVDRSIRDFANNVVAALAIVVVTLLIFMGLRSGLVMGATVLLTMAATLLLMWLIDVPMHRISLGALIISLGMLVDNGVVITDGILEAVRAGRNKLEAAREVATANFKPLLGGTLVGIIAFAPIGFAPGDTAEFTNSLFWVVMLALGMSWVFAFTLTPLFCYWFFPDPKPTGAAEGEAVEGRFMSWYRGVIQTALRFKVLSVALTVAVFAAALWGFQFVNVGFFPASTSPQIVVDYYLPQGTDIQRTNTDMRRLENYVSGLEGVNAVQTLVGGGALRYMLVYDSASATPSYGQLLIRTDDYRLNDSLILDIQGYLDESFPDGQGKVWKFQMGPGGGSKIEASFSGPDPKVLRKLSAAARALMAADGGAILIKDDWREQVPVLQPMYSPARGERAGISRKDLAEALQENFSGVRRGTFRERDKLIPIISRPPANERQNSFNAITIPILSPTTGASVPLSQVVDSAELRWRDGQILRTDRVLSIKAQCDPAAGVRADDLYARLKPGIESLELPPGYRLKWEGEFGNSAEAQGNLATTIPLGLLAMVLVVVVLFNALRQPMVIWFVVPLAIVGVTVGLVATQTPFEFMGILGLLSLSGLLIQNSLVLVDSTDELIAQGVPRFDALVDAAASRLRPVTMGAFTTVLGVLPLYFDAFFRSMTVVIAGGLSFATLITLLVTPCLYALLFGIQPNEVRS